MQSNYIDRDYYHCPLIINMKLFSLLLLFSNLIGLVRSDISPNPNPYYVTNVDGVSQGPIYLKGSAKGSWEEDEEGYSVLPDDKHNYFYGKQDSSTGDLVRTNMPLRKKVNGVLIGVSPSKAGIPLHAQPSKDAQLKKCGDFCEKNSGHDRQLRKLVSTKGTMKNLMVLFKFSDHVNRTLPSPENITTLMNHPGDGTTTAYDPLAPTGSVREHYLKSSYGQLTINSVVSDWVTIDYTEAYCSGGQSGLVTIIHTCLANALSKVDAQVNFTEFDTDGDRYIDAIGFLHSGYGAEWGGTDSYGAYYTSRIWSHKWGMSTWTSAEGVRVSSYHISPSVWGTSGSSIGRIGVIAHETGHYLGLPDLYDGGDSDADGRAGQGIGSWGLMANSWGFDGSQLYPPPMDAWSKIALGWVTPTVITPSTAPYSLSPQCQSTTIFKITTNFPQGEYLLIENRQKVCFYDSKMGGTYTGGLAIFHIDENQGSWTKEGYPGQSGWPGNWNHYRVAVLQADKFYELEKGVNRGNSGDLYHAGDTLGPSTNSTGPYPNSDSYAYGKVVNVTGITISNITASGNNMSFVFTVASLQTKKPSAKPSRRPSMAPSAKPSRLPTTAPSNRPTATSTGQLTRRPSMASSVIPSRLPTTAPSNRPTGTPTGKPTGKPSASPLSKPTRNPTMRPTRRPTRNPTTRPTVTKPTRRPTVRKPTTRPTVRKPTRRPTVRKPTAKPKPVRVNTAPK